MFNKKAKCMCKHHINHKENDFHW